MMSHSFQVRAGYTPSDLALRVVSLPSFSYLLSLYVFLDGSESERRKREEGLARSGLFRELRRQSG